MYEDLARTSYVDLVQIHPLKICGRDLAEKSLTYSGECDCLCRWIAGPSQQARLLASWQARSVYEIPVEALYYKSSLGIGTWSLMAKTPKILLINFLVKPGFGLSGDVARWAFYHLILVITRAHQEFKHRGRCHRRCHHSPPLDSYRQLLQGSCQETCFWDLAKRPLLEICTEILLTELI